jgi:hypothetical protein
MNKRRRRAALNTVITLVSCRGRRLSERLLPSEDGLFSVDLAMNH